MNISVSKLLSWTRQLYKLLELIPDVILTDIEEPITGPPSPPSPPPMVMRQESAEVEKDKRTKSEILSAVRIYANVSWDDDYIISFLKEHYMDMINLSKRLDVKATLLSADEKRNKEYEDFKTRYQERAKIIVAKVTRFLLSKGYMAIVVGGAAIRALLPDIEKDNIKTSDYDMIAVPIDIPENEVISRKNMRQVKEKLDIMLSKYLKQPYTHIPSLLHLSPIYQTSWEKFSQATKEPAEDRVATLGFTPANGFKNLTFRYENDNVEMATYNVNGGVGFLSEKRFKAEKERVENNERITPVKISHKEPRKPFIPVVEITFPDY